MKAAIEDRDTYLSAVNAGRRLAGGDYSERPEDKVHDAALAAHLDEPKFQQMAAEEEFILTVAEDGLGKRTSAYDYRISNRGGKGVTSMDLKRGGGFTRVISTIPVIDTDQLVMVSDGGQLIRLPVGGISFTGRTERGVTLFRVGESERVVSVTRFREVSGQDANDAIDDAAFDEGPGEVTPSEE